MTDVVVPALPGVDVDNFYPIFARRLAAGYTYCNGRASSGVRTKQRQAELFYDYKHNGGNTAADPNRPIGHRVFFAGTEYEISGDAEGSWHMEQIKMRSRMFPSPLGRGWGFAVDTRLSGGIDLAKLDEVAPWYVPGFKVQPPSRFGVCRDVGPTSRNPRGEPWHIKPDPRVARTMFDLLQDEEAMTPELKEALEAIRGEIAAVAVTAKAADDHATEAVELGRRLRTELIGDTADNTPKRSNMVGRLVKKAGA